MKNLIVICLLVLGVSCKTKKATVKAKDGSNSTARGLDGRDGLDGNNGLDGLNGTNGKDGKNGTNGSNGANGKDGINGTNGSDGKDGAKGEKGNTGSKGSTGAKGEKGDKGDKGEDGKDGGTGVVMKAFKIPVKGSCYKLADGIYAENEGDHADIYNNSDCDHGNSPKKVYCNDMRDGEDKYSNEICWVGCRQYSIEGAYSGIVIYELDFCPKNN